MVDEREDDVVRQVQRVPTVREEVSTDIQHTEEATATTPGDMVVTQPATAPSLAHNPVTVETTLQVGAVTMTHLTFYRNTHKDTLYCTFRLPCR